MRKYNIEAILISAMPGLNGIEVTRKIRSELTTTKVIALSMHADRRFVMGAPNSLLVGSGLCFLMILATCIAIPQLWRYRSD